MNDLTYAATSVLDIAFESSGPPDGPPVLLLHGWPDDVRTWDGIRPTLARAGWRTIAPYLRGCGPTRFRSHWTMRSGQLAAIGLDVIELADALRLRTFAVVGHDWGARAAYIAAALVPQRVTHCIALSVGWGTNDPSQALSLEQARNYWYQWFLTLGRGEQVLRSEGKRFARFLWQTWGPAGWIADEDFEATARSFDNPDWPEVTLHSYRHRWGLVPGDPAYAELEAKLKTAPAITVPTLLLHGDADACNDPETSAGRETLFTGTYQRLLIEGIGHFPTREAPEAVAGAILAFLYG